MINIMTQTPLKVFTTPLNLRDLALGLVKSSIPS